MNPQLARFEHERTPKRALPGGRLAAVALDLNGVVYGTAAYQAGKHTNYRDGDQVGDEREKQFGVIYHLQRLAADVVEQVHVGIFLEKSRPLLQRPGVANEKSINTLLTYWRVGFVEGFTPDALVINSTATSNPKRAAA